MILARCIRRCWDSQVTKRYQIGDIAELPEDHVFLAQTTEMKQRGTKPCFIPITADELAKSKDETQTQLKVQAEVIASLNRKIEELTRRIEGTEDQPEEKRGPGRPKRE